jgi:hypothetical protein
MMKKQARHLQRIGIIPDRIFFVTKGENPIIDDASVYLFLNLNYLKRAQRCRGML